VARGEQILADVFKKEELKTRLPVSEKNPPSTDRNKSDLEDVYWIDLLFKVDQSAQGSKKMKESTTITSGEGEVTVLLLGAFKHKTQKIDASACSLRLNGECLHRKCTKSESSRGGWRCR